MVYTYRVELLAMHGVTSQEAEALMVVAHAARVAATPLPADSTVKRRLRILADSLARRADRSVSRRLRRVGDA